MYAHKINIVLSATWNYNANLCTTEKKVKYKTRINAFCESIWQIQCIYVSNYFAWNAIRSHNSRHSQHQDCTSWFLIRIRCNYQIWYSARIMRLYFTQSDCRINLLTLSLQCRARAGWQWKNFGEMKCEDKK